LHVGRAGSRPVGLHQAVRHAPRLRRRVGRIRDRALQLRGHVLSLRQTLREGQGLGGAAGGAAAADAGTIRGEAVGIIARIKQAVPYVRLKEWTKAVRRRGKLSHYRGTQYRCPICEVRLKAFKPIFRSFWMHYQQYEYSRSPFDMETFNVGAFSCPSCDSYDRERLTALYLERALAAFDARRRYRLVEF